MNDDRLCPRSTLSLFSGGQISEQIEHRTPNVELAYGELDVRCSMFNVHFYD